MVLRLFCCIWPALIAGAGPETLPYHPIIDPAFQQELNAKTNSVLSVSDEIQLLVDGRESYPVRWRMLENAKESIHFTTMYIFRDKTTKRLADLLVRKKNEGVDVKMIVYGAYSLGNFDFYLRMQKSGIEVQLYSSLPDFLFRNPLRFWTRHLHDKYLVVDGKEALLGGMNWSGRYARGGTSAKVAWRDTDIYLRGPQAEVMEKEFMARWNRKANPEEHRRLSAELDAVYAKPMYPESIDYSDCVQPDADGDGRCEVRHLTRFLCQQPYEQNGIAYMTNFYKEIIDRAQKCVFWQSISTRPAPVQKKALMDAAARGVNVCLISNSKRNMHMLPAGGKIIYPLTRVMYRELLEAGVRIFEYSGPAPMHSKGFLVDDVVATIGSYNATFTSERYYTESGLVVYDTEAIRAIRRMIEDDLALCKEVTLHDLKPEKRRS
jgi:cardiolipin synthase